MQIAIVDMDNINNPFWGAGQARATFEVGKLLAKKHTVTVYCAKYPGWKDCTSEGLRYIHVGADVKSAFLTNLFFVFTIPWIGSRLKADIIVENFNAPFSVSFLPLFTRIPVVALPTMFNAITFSKKYHLPFHWVESIGIKTYKYMLAYSDVDSNKAKKMNHSIECKIVPQGVSKDFFQIKRLTPKYILFLGRFDNDQKGIDLLIRAYSQVRDTIEYPLILAGHGPDEKKIRKLIDALKLNDRITIVGSAYGRTKTKLLEKALFTAFPSRHDEMSLWALESLASGLPLVSFDCPEYKWVPTSVCLKAPAFDVKAYAKLLLRASNKNTITTMQRNARKFARQFSWEFVAREFESFFRYILSKQIGGSIHSS